MRPTMKELLVQWRKKTTQARPTRRNRVISESNRHENSDEAWYSAMDALVKMAHNKSHVTIGCAQKALRSAGFWAADVEYAIKLVAAAIGDGVLGAMPHPKHPEVTVYVPRD